MKRPYYPEDTVIINMSDSVCNSCGFGCSPSEGSHQTILGYQNGGEPGCGIVWTKAASDYSGVYMKESVADQWPQYEWVGSDD